MNYKLGLVAIATSLVMLTACSDESSVAQKHNVTFHLYDEITNVVEVEHNQTVAKPEDPTRDGYIFAGWFNSLEGSEDFYFGTPIIADTDIFAHWSEDVAISTEILKAALNQDYTNSEVTFDTTAEIKDPFIVHNYNGYNIAEPMLEGQGTGDYLYYHDYEGASYNYFYDKALGGAWIKDGIVFQSGGRAELGIEHIYFKPSYNLKAYTAEDFVYRAGSFHLINADKVNLAASKGAFDYIYENDIAQVSITLDDTRTYVSKIITFDSNDPNDERCSVTTIFNYNQVEWRLSELPPEPTKDNVKDWYDWKQEEMPTYDKLITAINLEFVGDLSKGLYVDQKFQIHYTFTPVAPDRKDIVFNVTGPTDGLSVGYDFGDQLLQGVGSIPGTYKISLTDSITKVESNVLEITIHDTKESAFDYANCLYDLEVNFENGVAGLYNYIDATDVAALKGSPQCFKAVPAFSSSDNPKFNSATSALEFNFCINDSLNVKGKDSYAIIKLNKDVNALSFTYGAVFESHVKTIKSSIGSNGLFSAAIETSSNGIDWVVAKDWTDECKNNISSHTTRRLDVQFESATKYVRIAFDSLTINHGVTIAIDSLALYNNVI